MATKMDKKHCAGCRDNFYNGNNDMGITECWSLETAKLVRKKLVPLDQRPPWNQPAQAVPSCYSKSGYVCVDPDRTC